MTFLCNSFSIPLHGNANSWQQIQHALVYVICSFLSAANLSSKCTALALENKVGVIKHYKNGEKIFTIAC